ncbi:uncharacterized protein LOC129270599 [Lytechinus pictus]|uniref:uncharacterized protein LOC129270599 n=1 Tax=Lytechinus pictus TaxID=7653 RepID=UPI0030B9FFC2
MEDADIAQYQRQINRANSISLKKESTQDEGKVRHYNGKVSTSLGILLILCAISSIIVGIVALIVESEFHDFGPGIWAGMFFLAPGVFGIVARNKMRCLVFGFLGSSVASLVISSDLIVILCIGLSTDHIQNDREAIIVNIVGITIALTAMMTSLFAIVLCSIPFCRPPDKTCPHCPSKQAMENLGFTPDEHPGITIENNGIA